MLIHEYHSIVTPHIKLEVRVLSQVVVPDVDYRFAINVAAKQTEIVLTAKMKLSTMDFLFFLDVKFVVVINDTLFIGKWCTACWTSNTLIIQYLPKLQVFLTSVFAFLSLHLAKRIERIES